MVEISLVTAYLLAALWAALVGFLAAWQHCFGIRVVTARLVIYRWPTCFLTLCCLARFCLSKMEDSSFFRDVHNVDITNGDFAVKYGPDNSHRTTNYGRVHNDYDHSRHNTHFERYNNHGQHIATNNGPVNFGHPPPDGQCWSFESDNIFLSSPDGGYFYQDTRPHRPMRGRTPHMRRQAQARNYLGDPPVGSDRGFPGSSDNSRSSSGEPLHCFACKSFTNSTSLT